MNTPARRGHPVTAWSAVNSLGRCTAEVLAGLRRGRPSLSPPPTGTPFTTVCGAVAEDMPPLPDSLRELDSRNNRFVQQALAEMKDALAAACERWGPARLGICVGTSTAAMDETERAYAIHRETGSLPEGFDVLGQASPEGLIRVLRALTNIEGDRKSVV